MESISLIDMDSEGDDLLFTTTTTASTAAVAFVAPPETLEHGDANDTNDMKNLNEHKTQVELVPVQPGSVEPKRGAPKKYNLRKSLAWDSAFFTCEGVLDPEELVAVSSKVGKMKLPALPGIQEDMRKSCESNATLDNIESIELGLFESSITSSIQKPPEKYGKECKNVTVSSQKLMKSTVTFNMNKNNAEQVKMKSSNELVQQRMANNRNGELKSSLKPPRVASGMVASNRRNPAPEPIQGKDNKSHKTLSGSSDDQKPIVLSKKIGTREQHLSLQRSSSSSGKFSRVPNPSKKIPSTVSCSTSTGSKGNASDIKISKKKVDSVNVEKSTKDAASKILPKISKTKKEQCEIPTGKSKRFFSSTLLSTGSPNRSFDSMASESSFSSISTGNSSVSSTEIRVSKSLMVPVSTDIHAPLCKHQHNNSLNSKAGNSGTSMQNHYPKKPSLRSEILNDTPVSDDSSDQHGKISLTTGFKPSGLRLPSPKFGYFGVEKSATCNTTTSKQVLPIASRRNTTGINKPNILTKPLSSKIKSATVDKKANASSLITTTIPSFGGSDGSQMISKRLSELASNLQSEAKPEVPHESVLNLQSEANATVDKKANASSLITTTIPSFGGSDGSQMISKRLSELASNLQSEAKPEVPQESVLNLQSEANATVDKKVNASSLITTTIPSFGGSDGSQMISKRLSELASNLQSEAKPEVPHESVLIFEKKDSNQNELILSQHAKLVEGEIPSDLLHSQVISGLDKENLLPPVR